LTVHRFFKDETERRKWQNPEAILADIGLKPGSTFIDVGCGYGFFALPAARLVGEKGRVYGLDVDAEAIEKLRETASKEDLQNLNLKVGEAEKTILCEACADFVFFGIVLHDLRNPTRVLMNAKKMLKQTGRLVDLDWKKEPMEFGPPLKIRFDEEQAVNLVESASFRIKTVKDAGPYHYIIIAKP
jgi:ubiquinone/menaquinone biosynthesis C-methylase UbiE